MTEVFVETFLIKSGKYLFVQQNFDIFQIITRIFKRKCCVFMKHEYERIVFKKDFVWSLIFSDESSIT